MVGQLPAHLPQINNEVFWRKPGVYSAVVEQPHEAMQINKRSW